ncbi:acyltransferase family protein [Escherichia coli]|uniref:acyltransferase family protein n=1 Tax=Escherichia coli TaxID=562 RepID=UPI003F759D3A|nr:acyltransferase [Escherichia coli]
MSKVKFLDGLRGICCFIVLIDHSINVLKPDLRHTGMTDIGGYIRRIISLSPLNIIYSGIGPVCIFFILSGFVLSIKYFKNRDGNLLVDGCIKRYPRLMLPILSSLVFMYVMYQASNMLLGSNFELTFFDALYQAVYLAPFTHSPMDNYPLWTISYEVLGSFLLFATVALFAGQKKRVAFTFVVFAFLYLSNSLYCLFIFGSILCEFKNHKLANPSRLIKGILFLIGLLFISTPFRREGVELYAGVYKYLSVLDWVDYRKLYNLLLMTGSMMVFYSVLNSELAVKTLGTKLFVFLGRISFPLYLTHATILALAVAFMNHKGMDQSLYHYAVMMVFIVPICLLVSDIFERFIDVPAVRFSSKVSKAILQK